MPKKPDAKLSKPDQLSMAAELIEQRIFLIRGHKVMIDANLADLYQVTTGNLNLAVKRNLDRFPEDFMFQLTRKEFVSLRFQSAISNRGGRRYLPYAFTEHGVAMLSSVLNSQRAVQMNILIIRAFIKLRELLATHTELARAQQPTCGSLFHSQTADRDPAEIVKTDRFQNQPIKRGENGDPR